MVGSLRYASTHTMNGISQSRRDDMESLGYMFAYFLQGGKLPWKDLVAKSRNDLIDKIKEKKNAF